MRKALLTSLFLSLAAAGASATQFWYDVVTNYPGGCITTNSSGAWFPHLPGSMTATDALVITNTFVGTYTSGSALSGRRLRINGLNSEYIERWLDPTTGGITNTFSSGALYVSFIANANFVPSGGAGTYFAALNDGGVPFAATNGFEFRGRISEIGNFNVYPFTTNVSLTYRFGIANANDDLPKAPGPDKYVPIDAIKNVDYQVVMKFDIDAATATLWVNPASESDTANSSGATSDFSAVTNGFAALLFRQRTTGGTMDIRDIAVGTSFADVMTNVAASSQTFVATNYNTVTNYVGNPALLEVFATSFGGGPLSYQWYQVTPTATNAVGTSKQTYVVPALAGTDTGNYFCAVTNSGGQGNVSTNKFYISVNTTPTPPFFTVKPPATTNGTVGGKLTLAAAASGTGPLTFQWSFNNNPLTDGSPVTGNVGDLSVVAGSQTPTLVVTGLSTNETGSFSVLVTSGASGLAYTTTNTAVATTVNPARPVSIAFIRSLEDTTTWQVTDTGSIFALTNAVVTMYTNTTTGVTASYYIQDATGGLDLFVTGDATFRPAMGDIVAVSGTLSSFNNGIELLIDTSNPYETYTITGHTNNLPVPIVFNMANTNNAGLMETNLEGRLAILTNVAFNANYTLGTSQGSGSVFVTNLSGGLPFNVFFPAGVDLDVQSRTLPAAGTKVWTISGVLAQSISGAYSAKYEFIVTRFGDILTNPPPAVTAVASTSGNDVVLNWMAVPYTADTRGAYSYTVLGSDICSSNNADYHAVASGLAFVTTNGTYTVTNALLGTQKFYKIASP